ncbi:hypothetical protein CJ178_30385 [Rhodococcus sp. ACPA4]|uniref:hypothetical protein n=1 Tax=Rhodococcus sp. ACPA4 TaxID=2028571 RepID=UPI000BB104AB|nr:hypothetical protein [Rhodococcus sp. ACPA4]PBC35779.1 hypothetical protein CJ178_30385 [Rhodococcus sp. ACPA4]
MALESACATPSIRTVISSLSPITAGARGAGFGDPRTNKVVEDAAVGTATDHYTNLGYDVEDVGARNLGWGLTCIHVSGDIREWR